MLNSLFYTTFFPFLKPVPTYFSTLPLWKSVAAVCQSAVRRPSSLCRYPLLCRSLSAPYPLNERIRTP